VEGGGSRDLFENFSLRGEANYFLTTAHNLPLFFVIIHSFFIRMTFFLHLKRGGREKGFAPCPPPLNPPLGFMEVFDWQEDLENLHHKGYIIDIIFIIVSSQFDQYIWDPVIYFIFFFWIYWSVSLASSYEK